MVARLRFNCDYTFHRFDTIGQRAIIKERLLSAPVISDIRIRAVVTCGGIVREEHLPTGETLSETAKRFQTGWNQTKFFPTHYAYDGVTSELLPPALSLTVIHNEIRISELAGRPEIEHAILNCALENEGGITKGAVGNHNGCASD